MNRKLTWLERARAMFIDREVLESILMVITVFTVICLVLISFLAIASLPFALLGWAILSIIGLTTELHFTYLTAAAVGFLTVVILDLVTKKYN